MSKAYLRCIYRVSQNPREYSVHFLTEGRGLFFVPREDVHVLDKNRGLVSVTIQAEQDNAVDVELRDSSGKIIACRVDRKQVIR